MLSRIAALVLVLFSLQASAETLSIRIGTPDQSVNAAPSGGISITTFLDVRKTLEEEFAKDGVKIEWIYFKGAGPAINEALANKQLDFAYIGDLAAIIGKANGLATRFVVSARGNNSYLGVAPNSGIATLADLKGKRVAVFKGTAYQLSLDHAIASVGLKERDLQAINLDWPSSLAALAAQQVDATWAGLQVITLEQKGLAKTLLSTKDLGRTFSLQSGLVATQDFLNRHPDYAQRLVTAVVKTQAFLSDPANLETFLNETSQRSGVPAGLGRRELAGDDLKFRFSPRVDDFIVEAFQKSVDEAKELGLIRKTFDVKAWVDPSLAEKAIEDLKLQGFWPRYNAAGEASSS